VAATAGGYTGEGRAPADERAMTSYSVFGWLAEDSPSRWRRTGGRIAESRLERRTSPAPSPNTRRLLRGATSLVRRSSGRRSSDREAVLLALAASDEELAAVGERRRLYKKVVATLAVPFLISELTFAWIAWQGLMLVQEEKYEPNYLQWKVILGFVYYGTWTYAIKNCADICLSDCAALFPSVRILSDRNVLASVFTSFLGYVPGMWCCSLFLAFDSLPAKRRRPEFCRKVAEAGYLQLLVLLIAWAVIAVRARDKAAIAAIRSRLQDTLAMARGLLNGCEELVHQMRKVPWKAEELVDPDDGEVKECPICAAAFTADLPIVSTACNHLFHEECLATWCNTQHVCPLCRCDLRDGPAHSLLSV